MHCGLSVCLHVYWLLEPHKAAEPIEMLFGMLTHWVQGTTRPVSSTNGALWVGVILGMLERATVDIFNRICEAAAAMRPPVTGTVAN